MVDQDGRQPGDPSRRARAVIAATERESPPHRLVLGADAFNAVTATLEEAPADIRAGEALSRDADFTPGLRWRPPGPKPSRQDDVR
jgi:hypothetical protein